MYGLSSHLNGGSVGAAKNKKKTDKRTSLELETLSLGKNRDSETVLNQSRNCETQSTAKMLNETARLVKFDLNFCQTQSS